MIHETNLLVFILLSVAIPSGALTLISAVIPGWLALTAYRQRSWSLAIALLAYVAVGVLEPVQRVLTNQFLAIFGAQNLTGELVFQQGASAVAALLLPLLLVNDAVRARRAGPACAAALFLVALALPFVHLHFSTMHSVAESHPRRLYWWLDELVAERCLVALVCTPGGIFWWALWQNLRQNRVGRAAGLIVAATVAGAVAAAAFLAVDSMGLPEGVRPAPRRSRANGP